MGGANISSTSKDVGLGFNNPALLNASMHTQLNTSFNFLYAGIHGYHLSMGYHHAKLKTDFAWGMTYYDYGTIAQTDASGNQFGNFRPVDWVMQLSASHSYLEKWHYGMTMKFINSDYGLYRSNGIAFDAGLLYHDTAHLFSASVVARNMGFQLKKYDGAVADDLPFDLSAGFTKKLAGAPFSFSLTAVKIHQYNIRYNDTVFNNENGIIASKGLGKVADHLVLSSSIYLGDRIECIVGYNFLRRRELNTGNSGNGLNGFSAGLAADLGKFTVTYARSYYQSNRAMNQFGLHLILNKLTGLGRFGQRIGW